MSRPLMAALTAQQLVIDDQRKQLAAQAALLEVQGKQISLIARLAGVTTEVDALAKTADIANPAQPIPDGPEQAPSETTEQAATPETNDDVRSPGQTGNSTAGVPAAATDTALTPGGTLPAEPYGNLQDVTSPVSGVNTGEVPLDETRIETDVRVGDPAQWDVAFPWTMGDNKSNSNPVTTGEMAGASGGPSRTHACLRLARLQIQAGIASGDDLTVSARLEGDASLSDELINREIGVLDRVMKAASARTAPSGGRVAARSAERVAPSLAAHATASAAPLAGTDEVSDLFD
ncbi:hypothetical protein FNV58_01375 (plasmid) [Streptomyces sp. RLB1-9]|uniref:hypothetical protein n=1 Tax=Streptomyces sp. RLB1-9 TaxID=2594454 RepID=UPI001162354A|nr:hypothetical protein [Streptomyces sp. RLB1-9]QDN95013.1 hypothetical protein FNV58_01375 [Streptomyces sp. RLB1-9]